MSSIKVLIVDDSAVLCQVLTAQPSARGEVEITGVAADLQRVGEALQAQWPDVIVLQLGLAGVDDVALLRQILAERPTPVVVSAPPTEAGIELAMDALGAGAVCAVTRPTGIPRKVSTDLSDDLLHAVRAASHARIVPAGGEPIAPRPITPRPIAACPSCSRFPPVVAIGASAGGARALETVLRALPADSPGVVAVVHMPEGFTAAFARLLNPLCQVEVREARHGDRVLPGRVLLAPGGAHMLLKRSGTQYVVDIIDGPAVSRRRPSVDVLFRSVARFAGKEALGIIMTGMGNDGVRGLKEMHEAGARTIAQDEAGCVGFNMPGEAIRMGAVTRVLPLQAIPEAIMGSVEPAPEVSMEQGPA
ncbi:MAG: chemotaxis-specific protein-glutamate methyltransferase CheB [Zoogloea sp.]|uniref:chemotaxis-specific protein-glutamate methyltransferase CheB n=1 Tax=Zoogloea sp. TaxID=49181 RepID=UPI0026346B2E|nr:chemotaxis-specific protein-glutamate methyltransferase CheB [Zoogloea sp.]MDD2991094.1 chemotaxis-specific protein-glutamate methyltransferase CheB [Zoogloea sp.]